MRYYLDYNSTSPMASTVKDWLKKEDLPFANASSIHQAGKESRKYINETTAFLKDLFKASDFKVIYHSGASEGINTIIKGWCLDHENGHIFCSEIDHAAALKCKKFAKKLGVTFHLFPVDKNGMFNLEELIQKIKSCQGPCLLNFTWVHNVTGVIWDLEIAEVIKKETGATIHVDAVQVPGKIKDWEKLNNDLDFYTFSGHKFGSLKGVGLTFYKENFAPLIEGGGQQNGLRSGTENVTGVYSLKLALKELKDNFDFEKLNEAKVFLENSIKDFLGEKGLIVAENAKRNGNTIFFLQHLESPDMMQMALDVKGIEIGTGSACSSGIQVPDRILISLGYSESDALRGIRLSLGPNADIFKVNDVWEQIKEVFTRYCRP